MTQKDHDNITRLLASSEAVQRDLADIKKMLDTSIPRLYETTTRHGVVIKFIIAIGSLLGGTLSSVAVFNFTH